MQPGFVKTLLKCSKFDSKSEKTGKIAKTLLKRSKTCPTCQNCKGVPLQNSPKSLIFMENRSIEHGKSAKTQLD